LLFHFERSIAPYPYPRILRALLLAVVIFLLWAGSASAAEAVTVKTKYPDLASGILASAILASMPDETLLLADDLEISRAELVETVQKEEKALRAQLEKNLFFLLEQEATRRILLKEARKAGVAEAAGDDSETIQALFEQQTGSLTVSEADVRAFYEQNQEMMGGAPFERVAENIRQYLLQDRKQAAVSKYILGLGDSVNLRVNEKWVEEQNRLAMDNPVERARRSGKPTMVEFGASGCVPCDMMQPILEKLRKEYPEKLNVVFVHAGEEQVLAARYGIRSIPVQAFFDANGSETFRHVGFFSESEVLKQLARIGVVQ